MPSYRDRILENNINGRVLITCDMNELREAMQMKFGDWQLFKAWINSSRFKDNSSRYEVFHIEIIVKAERSDYEEDRTT